ncbi:hypothetical protein DFH11DRAFT_122100 [Phellopilus nigrolimitatus]|nr:hypothetical protein DFH11DRAFT_122100 [Phellopilus nigrolimitatus]
MPSYQQFITRLKDNVGPPVDKHAHGGRVGNDRVSSCRLECTDFVFFSSRFYAPCTILPSTRGPLRTAIQVAETTEAQVRSAAAIATTPEAAAATATAATPAAAATANPVVAAVHARSTAQSQGAALLAHWHGHLIPKLHVRVLDSCPFYCWHRLGPQPRLRRRYFPAATSLRRTRRASAFAGTAACPAATRTASASRSGALDLRGWGLCATGARKKMKRVERCGTLDYVSAS